MTRFPIPQNDGLTLVGDANGCDTFGAGAGSSQRLLCHIQLRTPDFFRVVFYPAWLRVVLFEFLAGTGTNVAARVEQDSARTGCALVKGENEFWSHERLRRFAENRGDPAST